jgi:hypothetical protein
MGVAPRMVVNLWNMYERSFIVIYTLYMQIVGFVIKYISYWTECTTPKYYFGFCFVCYGHFILYTIYFLGGVGGLWPPTPPKKYHIWYHNSQDQDAMLYHHRNLNYPSLCNPKFHHCAHKILAYLQPADYSPPLHTQFLWYTFNIIPQSSSTRLMLSPSFRYSTQNFCTHFPPMRHTCCTQLSSMFSITF